MSPSIEIWEGEPRVGTYLVAIGFEREHKKVLELVRTYEEEFLYFGPLKGRKLKSTGGRAANEFMLNEEQTMLLGTLLRNSKKSVEFKKLLVAKFKEIKDRLNELEKEQETKKYIETREAGKIVRKHTTDAMQEFSEYAKSQGSGSPEKYFIAITKMMNGLLFIVDGKYKNLRDVMTVQQLMTVSSAETIIDRGLRDGMSRKKFYKDIFQDVKKRVFQFAELHGQTYIIEAQLKLDNPEQKRIG